MKTKRLPLHAKGLTTLYYPSSSTAGSIDAVDIVAVPGLGVNGDQSWIADNGINWLSEENMLPFWVPRCRIMHFSYSTCWLGEDSIQKRLPQIADDLLQGIMAFRKNHLTRPLVFIGHCFGGLVIQKAILLAKIHDEEYPLLAKCLAGVVFLGTPHKASSKQSKAEIIAAIASAVGYEDPPALLNSIERDSDALADLLQEFARIANIHAIPLFCFVERFGRDGFKASRDIGRLTISHAPGGDPRSRELSPAPDKPEFVVDAEAGSIDGFPSESLSTDHFGLAKFAHPDDEKFILIRQTLVKFVESAKSCVAKRLKDPSRENEKCLNALFVTDPLDDMETVEHNNGKLLEGSGAWLQENSNFKEWLQCKATRVLWICGNPGKGKTMLTISVVRNFLGTLNQGSPAPDVLFAYFFCDNKDNRRISSIAVLRNLLYQILQQRPDLCAEYRVLYDREGDQLFTSPTALQTLWRILRNMFSSRSIQKIYLIVDALDELEENATEDLLKILRPLLDPEPCIEDYQQCRSQEASCEVKWLLTSRHMHHISSTLGRALNISLEDNSDHVNATVYRFIDNRVDELQILKRYDATLAEFVRDALREKSEGTFLYVSMACRELSKPGVRLINTVSVLSKLPRGLTPLYQRILDQSMAIEEEDLVQHMKTILRSMVLALRPLTVYELAIAASLPEKHHNDTGMLDEYISLCGSFISRRENTVHFVHETVKTYLLSLVDIFPSEMFSYHAELTQSFIDHINNQSTVSTDKQEVGPFLEYPSVFWLHHVRHSGSYMQWQTNLSSKLFSRVSRVRQKWLEYFWIKEHHEWDKQPDSFTALQLAAYAGIEKLVASLLARGDAIDEADSNGLTALIWAAKNGYGDVVHLLLENGANCEAMTTDGLTSLVWATINGHDQVVQIFIEYGANIQVADAMGWTPLHHSAAHGHLKVLTRLLEAGANIDAKDVAQQSAVQRATFCGNLAVIKILVEKQANLGVNDKDGLTLLHIAARGGYLDLTEYWLSITDTLETGDDQGWTPLMHSAWFGQAGVAEYLIKQGGRLETKSSDGNTSLHLATWSGHADVVKILLNGKANPNSACDRQETPLQQAAWRGHATVCQLLLDAGAHPNATNDTGITPLHQAAANGHVIIARLLLDWGADPNALDSIKQTPGARAAENNHHTLAKFLSNLETGYRGEDTEDILPSEFEAVDSAVCELLNVPPESCIGQSYGKIGFSKPAKVTALINGVPTHYFMKSGPDRVMFATIADSQAAEHAALRALYNVVPSICPYSLGHGKFANSEDSFLLMEFIDTAYKSDNSTSSGPSLAKKLAQLHNTCAPVPDGYQQPMFGWPTPTYCGSTKQINTFCASWAKFYTENRLLAVLKQIDDCHGTDLDLRAGVEAVARKIVPQLLGNGHLGGRRGIVPVLVHGDLWIGNRVRGKIASRPEVEEFTYDPSVCYSHSEFEIGIMNMFGGFSAGFFHEYHRLVPKTEPKEEYEDRIKLYQLYQYLNHYLIFRGGYKDDVMDIVKTLIDKYA